MFIDFNVNLLREVAYENHALYNKTQGHQLSIIISMKAYEAFLHNSSSSCWHFACKWDTERHLQWATKFKLVRRLHG